MSRYIDKGIVLAEMDKLFFSDEMAEFRMNNGSNGQRDYIINFVKTLPTEEDVKPIVRGEWIEHKHNGIAHIECSKCLTWFPRIYLTRNSYCPNCGADMRKESEEGEQTE